MLILKTAPRYSMYLDFYEDNGEIKIHSKIEPELSMKLYRGAKDSIKEYFISDDPILERDFIVPMLILLKKYFPDKILNSDLWIDKCKNNEYFYDYYRKNKRSREYRLNNYQFILSNNKLNSDVIDDINSKIQKIETVYRVKNILKEYKQYTELKEKFEN